MGVLLQNRCENWEHGVWELRNGGSPAMLVNKAVTVISDYSPPTGADEA